jgi:choline dehydrogenase-like flavoprotein
VWGFDNVRINDASLVPDALGVNPRGTIMAIAARYRDQLLAEA